jgi:hypothetical protein
MRSSLVAVTLTFAVACSGYAFAVQQPLTRAGCGQAGLKWDDNANACAGGEAVVPEPAGAAEAAPAPAPKAEAAPMAKPTPATKVETTTKKVVVKKGGHVTKTHVHKKVVHTAPKKKHGGFFQWLSGKNKKS